MDIVLVIHSIGSVLGRITSSLSLPIKLDIKGSQEILWPVGGEPTC